MDFIHIIQSHEWNNFKKASGSNIVAFDSVYFNIKRVSILGIKIGYAPKVNFLLQKIDFEKLADFCEKEDISFIRFDSPNIVITDTNYSAMQESVEKYCVKSPRSSISKKTIVIDLTKSIDDLYSAMSSKRRYNIKLARKNGVTIQFSNDTDALERFISLYVETQKRQRFFGYNADYLRTFYSLFKQHIYFAEAHYLDHLCASWLMVNYSDIYYYLYGGSDLRYSNVFPNDLLGFKVIEHSKEIGGKLLDLWGADDAEGYTMFKLKFGGSVIEYIPSYDFIIDKSSYYLFNFLYNSFWKLPYFVKRSINTLYKKLG